ncbi:MAG: hypothetical protein EZS28_023592 [Streblomastix strix]|uniref:Uncharacterized protein n=1 Tax=Streblomastix strix TaxID=222440 RepID=A0A5J4VEK3_9EUKA|nr:MAG: hypothetical protein EZS28_023592 [Streblomastix strix]
MVGSTIMQVRQITFTAGAQVFVALNFLKSSTGTELSDLIWRLNTCNFLQTFAKVTIRKLMNFFRIQFENCSPPLSPSSGKTIISAEPCVLTAQIFVESINIKQIDASLNQLFKKFRLAIRAALSQKVYFLFWRQLSFVHCYGPTKLFQKKSKCLSEEYWGTFALKRRCLILVMMIIDFESQICSMCRIYDQLTFG